MFRKRTMVEENCGKNCFTQENRVRNNRRGGDENGLVPLRSIRS